MRGADANNRVWLVVVAFVVGAAYLYLSQPKTSSTSTLPTTYQHQPPQQPPSQAYEQQFEQPPKQKAKPEVVSAVEIETESSTQSGGDTAGCNKSEFEANAQLVESLRKEVSALKDRLSKSEQQQSSASSAVAAPASNGKCVATNKGHITKRASKQELPDWAKRVRDPAMIDTCRQWMGITGDGTSVPASQAPTILSQHWQDWFIYHNYFKGTGAGFYVDIGSNDPRQISNTYFLDMCLGWDGICIEPNPEYHDSYRKHGRTCKLYKNCLSDQDNQKMSFALEGTGSKIGGTAGTPVSGSRTIDVECRRLDSVLRESNVKRVDMMSLDIEGYEHTVLKATNFHEFDIQLILMETFWLQKDDTDILMVELGYSKVANLQIDDIYEYAINDPPLKFPKHLGFDGAMGQYKMQRDNHWRSKR